MKGMSWYRAQQRRRISAVVFVTAIILVVLTVATAEARVNYNDPAYWEGTTTHESSCYKHEGSHAHGVDNGDGSVTLSVFDQSWPGDHWELLVVKGGSVDYGFGPGNAVYDHPSAGVAYFAPLNDGGNQSEVSHWIVCKGTTPPVTTTTTTTPSTTTTTEPSTTTTTIITTTTTAPTTTTSSSTTTTTPTVTTTTPSSTTSTEPPTSTTTILPSTTVPPTTVTTIVTTTTVPTLPELPMTGLDTATLLAVAVGLSVLGASLVYGSYKRHKSLGR